MALVEAQRVGGDAEGARQRPNAQGAGRRGGGGSGGGRREVHGAAQSAPWSPLQGQGPLPNPTAGWERHWGNPSNNRAPQNGLNAVGAGWRARMAWHVMAQRPEGTSPEPPGHTYGTPQVSGASQGPTTRGAVPRSPMVGRQPGTQPHEAPCQTHPVDRCRWKERSFRGSPSPEGVGKRKERSFR